MDKITECNTYNKITPPNPPNTGILFVDHSANGRSGHLGHALVEYEDGKILAFYPNCSDDGEGHRAAGWMEYKRSEDGGYTWSEPYILKYSKNMFDEGTGRSSFCEKAVVTSNGRIVLFCLVCDISENTWWEPYLIPTYLTSQDGGNTWSESQELSGEKGRLYDAIYRNNTIFALEFCNDAAQRFYGTTEQHIYSLYTSTDNGESFSKRSDLPFNTEGKAYGTMEMLLDGRLIVYIYNVNDEQNLEYVLSDDNGYTWSEVKTAYFDKRIRNPQMVSIGDYYFIHGRSGNYPDENAFPPSNNFSGNFILYSSKDGIHWNDGMYLRMREAGAGAYSNSVVVGKMNPDKCKRLLIQASHAYEKHKTNVLHWWIENI